MWCRGVTEVTTLYRFSFNKNLTTFFPTFLNIFVSFVKVFSYLFKIL